MSRLNMKLVYLGLFKILDFIYIFFFSKFELSVCKSYVFRHLNKKLSYNILVKFSPFKFMTVAQDKRKDLYVLRAKSYM